ncbi:short-chain dehydrogenase/reductase isoform X1 [Apis mellifera]|uniref:Short-chain dehydrogenase/reductase isoform X1 n=1 Tax=Apis mellifera TaxID=7460 RepID=A0A7M7MU86_APIME|nr:short-chain dehydrogenase/reductase isoform X1 [Apis mellifera]|eukprot:XP_026301049.1 short-chain dehydrogenase/reductase isoform X1 [Apis mellifera]
MDRWAGKVAVVTGASAGIGAAIVKQLLTHGMVVAGLARRVEKIKELEQGLEECTGKLYAVECDVSKEESVIAAFAWVQENLGPANVLINNAGITKESSLIDGNLEDWRSVFDVNVFGLCLCTKEAIRMMRETGGEGVIININSLAGERVPFIPGFSVYPASKRAIAALAQTLRHELTGTQIRVTGISPGLVATELMVSYSTYSEEALASFPTLDPEDVATAAIYILSCAPHVVLRDLWNYTKSLSKRQELQEARHLFREAKNLVKIKAKLDKIYRVINKGLLHNPRFHSLHAIKGDLHFSEGKWTKAIQNYENAKLFAKDDYTLTKEKLTDIYNDQLVNAYKKRSEFYCENNMLLEALSDYEQIFLFKIPKINLMEIQDRLLEILRQLHKYDKFRMYWDQFIMNPDPMRASDLLAVHAEYKIHLKEMATARHMLLKVVFSTGHALSAYTVLWCMHSCYDKGLVTIEKALDCNPYNPGFNLLKTVVLRLSGRFEEANIWLESLNKNFFKLVKPTRDKEKSIMGKLSIKETRNHLIKQWYLIRYDMAMQCLLEDKISMAIQIVLKSNLVKQYPESYLLLGDCFIKRNEINLALKSYLKCRKKMRKLNLPLCQKTVDLAERIIDILNDKAEVAINNKDSKRAISLAEQILKIFDEDKIPLEELRLQRSRALIHKARGLFQMENKKAKRSSKFDVSIEAMLKIYTSDAIFAKCYSNKKMPISLFITYPYFCIKEFAMEQNWIDKVALVTGANSGIGKCLIECLVGKGMKVIGIAPQVDKMKTLVEELKSKPGKLVPLQCDLSNQNDILKVIEWVEKNLGAIDILINNATINIDVTLQNDEVLDWKKIFDINLLGLTCMIQEVLKLMKKKGINNGIIVNINDASGLNLLPMNRNRPAYLASKCALTTLTDCLRSELAQCESNIKVISISPDLVETDMTAQWLKENSRLALKPKDVSNCVLFALQTPDNVLIKELVVTPNRETI